MAAITGALMAGAGALINADSSRKAAHTAADAQREANAIDPRILDKIFGTNGVLNQPQSAGMGTFGGRMDDYLKDWGYDTFAHSQQRAQALQDSNIKNPTMQAAVINAPKQNDLNLSNAYNDMIYGDPAQNPYLTQALQGGIHQSQNAFDTMQQDATDNFTKNILGNIRGGAIANGQFGGSRQGVAESNAAGDFAKQMARATNQYGQHNTDAIVGAQSGAFDAGQNRALSAMGGLGSQQYNVAGQNAQFQQQANANNQQAAIDANHLNSANQATGVGLSSGLLGQAYGYGQNNDNRGLNRLGQIQGLLGKSNIQPTYANQGASALSGAMGGLGLFNAMGGSNMFGGGSSDSYGGGFDPNQVSGLDFGPGVGGIKG